MKFKNLAIGITIGNLVTSVIFYINFDIWEPMVWSAMINAVLLVGVHLVKFMDGLE